MTTLIRYKTNGSRRRVADFVARRLVANGIAELVDSPQGYLTRQMAAVDPLTPVMRPQNDGLDELDPDALRALAEARGLKPHHRAGPDKLRSLIRGQA